MFAWDGSVITLWACAPVNTSPCRARRSRFGVRARVFPAKPSASARSVSMVIRTTSGREEEAEGAGAVAGARAGRRQSVPPAAVSASSTSVARAGNRRVLTGWIGLYPGSQSKKVPPGNAPAGREYGDLGSLETDAGAQPHGPGVLNLLDRPEVAGAVLAVGVAARRGVSLPLQNRRGVQGVEEIGRQGDVGLREERDDLLDAQIELIHVLQTVVRRAAEKDGPGAFAVARVHLDVSRVQ